MLQRIALFGGALTQQIKNRYESSMGATSNFVLLAQTFGSSLILQQCGRGTGSS